MISSSPLCTLDVAHPPRHPDVVDQELLRAWAQVRNSSSLRVLKVVHGHGSGGKGGTTLTHVRNWAYRNRDRFRGVIEGERYGVHDAFTQEMRKEVGIFPDADLDNANPGILLVWVK